ALVIIIGGVLAVIMVVRRNEATQGQEKGHQGRRNERKSGPKEPPWQIGQKVPVNITVIAEDNENLECAYPSDDKGKHCAYESKDTVWSKGDNKDDKTLLRPYSTTSRQKLLAAGLWSQLTPPFPTKRFTVKCTFEIDAKLEKPLVRFSKGRDFT